MVFSDASAHLLNKEQVPLVVPVDYQPHCPSVPIMQLAYLIVFEQVVRATQFTPLVVHKFDTD